MNLYELDALSPDFEYENDESELVVSVGFGASFYFHDAHRKRTALAECVEEYERLYGSELRWLLHPQSGKQIDYGQPTAPSFREVSDSSHEDDCIEWFASSSTSRDTIGEFDISCLTARAWAEMRVSQFAFHVSRRCLQDPEARSKLDALIGKCTLLLDPFHGHAGLGVVLPEDQIKYEPDTLDLLTRFLGVSLDAMPADKIRAPFGIKGIDWLTIVGKALAERYGGVQPFLDLCRARGAMATQCGNAVVLRAGENPDIIPVPGPIPAAYKLVNDLVRPFRDGNFGSMGTGSINGELRFNEGSTDLFLRRFDVEGIWPPSTFAGIGDEPFGTRPRKARNLKTGERCEQHGRYKLKDNEEPRLILMPGDLAPYYVEMGAHGAIKGRHVATWELIAEL